MANPEDTPKGQHFLLSSECSTLNVLDLVKMRRVRLAGDQMAETDAGLWSCTCKRSVIKKFFL